MSERTFPTTPPPGPRPRPGAPVAPRFRWPPVIVTVAAILGCVAIGATAGSRPLVAIVGLVALLLALASLIRPEVATLVVIFILYSNAAVVAVTQFGMPVFIGAVVPMILVVPLAYELLVKRRIVVITPAFPWLVAFLLVQILGTLFARDMTSAADELVTFLLEGIGLYLLVVNVVRTPSEMRYVVWTLLAVGAFLGGLSIYQAATGTYSNDYFGFAQSDATNDLGVTVAGLHRLAGPIGEKNRYAQIMLMLVPLALFQAWSERNRLLRLAAYAVAILASGAVILTFSRGAAVGFALVVLIMVLLRYIKLWQLFLVGLLAVSMLIAVPAYADRLTTLSAIVDTVTGGDTGTQADNSILSRATENLAALNVFSDHPIVGVGPGQFPQLLSPVRGRDRDQRQGRGPAGPQPVPVDGRRDRDPGPDLLHDDPVHHPVAAGQGAPAVARATGGPGQHGHRVQPVRGDLHDDRDLPPPVVRPLLLADHGPRRGGRLHGPP